MFALHLLAATAVLADVAIIAHPGVSPVALDRTVLLDIYAGELGYWADRAPVRVFDLRDRAPAKEAVYQYLGRTPSQLKSIWMKKLLLGEHDPPVAVADDAEMLNRVAGTPGSIGYVDAERVSPQVKVLLVIAAARAQ